MQLKTHTSETTHHEPSNVSSSTNISRLKLTEEEKKRAEHLIRNAKSLQEIAALEKAMAEGRVPGTLGDDFRSR